MVKNKLEKIASKSLKEQFIWTMKLHNNPLSHQTTPADYIASHDNKILLIECKQVTCIDGKGRLAFSRLKQMNDLLAFHRINPAFHKAYFCIAYYNDRWDKSDVYLLDIETINNIVNTHNNVSLNRTDAFNLFKENKLELDGGVLKFKKQLK